MQSRSSRRTRDHEEESENDDGPSLLHLLFEGVADTLVRSAVTRLREGTHRVVTWTLRQALLGWTAAAVLTVGLVLLLVAAVKGLETAGCPSWVAYLSAGAAAILGALGMMRGILVEPPDGDEDDDS